jgi:hypothetical protein
MRQRSSVRPAAACGVIRKVGKDRLSSVDVQSSSIPDVGREATTRPTRFRQISSSPPSTLAGRSAAGKVAFTSTG